MRRPQVTIILVLLAVETSWSVPVSNDNAITSNSTENRAALSCVTGKHVKGTCVRREKCDYGTAAIDFTLYRPRGYKDVCLSEEVCCPPECLVQQDDRVWVPGNENFDFDDDD